MHITENMESHLSIIIVYSCMLDTLTYMYSSMHYRELGQKLGDNCTEIIIPIWLKIMRLCSNLFALYITTTIVLGTETLHSILE